MVPRQGAGRRVCAGAGVGVCVLSAVDLSQKVLMVPQQQRMIRLFLFYFFFLEKKNLNQVRLRSLCSVSLREEIALVCDSTLTGIIQRPISN